MYRFNKEESGRSTGRNIALVVSRGRGEPHLAHWEGEALRELWESGTLRAHFRDLEVGVWIWEGDVVTIRHNTPNGMDYDTELEGEFRELTDEEWEDWSDQPPYPPWDEGEEDDDEPVAIVPGPAFEALADELINQQNAALQNALRDYEKIREDGGTPHLTIQSDRGMVGYLVQDQREMN